MPELRHHRPGPTARPDDSDQARPRPARGPLAIGSWLRSAVDRWSPASGRESAFESLARIATTAREPEEIRVELVRLACQVAGASKVELFSDCEGRSTHRLACWPPSIPHELSTEARSQPRGPIAAGPGRSPRDRAASTALHLPLKAGESSFGTLRLTARGGRPWSDPVVRRLTTLCAIASSAERGLARPTRGEADPSFHPGEGPHGSTILAAFLSFAQAQARRRHEPLSLMEVAVDRLDSIRELLGEELAEAAVERISRAIKSTVRASDVVARLEEGRIAVLLPNASAENAQKVAESIRAAIARACAASTTMPSLTASVGLATYPDHAHDVATLRAAAASSLTRAREQGNDRIAVAPTIPSIASNGLAHRVG